MGNRKDSQEMVISPVLGFPIPMRQARLLSTQKMFMFPGGHCWALEALFSIACQMCLGFCINWGQGRHVAHHLLTQWTMESYDNPSISGIAHFRDIGIEGNSSHAREVRQHLNIICSREHLSFLEGGACNISHKHSLTCSFIQIYHLSI